MTEEIKQQQAEEDEIDLIALAKTLWVKRKFIIIVVVICMCIGVMVALLTPKEYTASSTMVPQISNGSSKASSLSSLAAMAGFNLDMSTSTELSPTVYPQIVQSIPFQLEMMNTPFKFPEVDKPVSYYTYSTELEKTGVLGTVKKYTIGLPFVILNAIKGDKPEVPNSTSESNSLISLTPDQDRVRKQLEKNITLDVNEKEGYLTLSVKAPDAVLAAQMAQKALTLLQQYITDIKIEKATDQLNFIEERYLESKKEYNAARNALAAFKDKNKNVTSARAQIQEQQLNNDYNLAYNVYSELAKQLEQARIQEKEDTPVFSVLKPVSVPLEDNNSGMMTLIIWTFLGAVIAIGWILGKHFLVTVKEKWNETAEES
jgi:uncharacterized protein involved in exopolysaccharide biosynthesis